MKLLLIGNGSWSKNYQKTLNEFDIQFDIGTRENWKQLAESKKYQGVIIATPPQSHIEIAHFCLSHDLPVIIEKPLCLSLNEISKIEGFSAPILVNHIHLFSPYYQFLKSYISQFQILKIDSFGFGNGPVRDYSSLYNYGSHDLSMIFDLCNKQEAVGWFLNKRFPGDIHGECFDLGLEIKNGVHCNILTGNGWSHKSRYLSVMTDHGRFVYNDLATPKLAGFPSVPEFTSLPLEETIWVFLGAIEGKSDYRLGLDNSKMVLDALDIFEVL